MRVASFLARSSNFVDDYQHVLNKLLGTKGYNRFSYNMHS